MPDGIKIQLINWVSSRYEKIKLFSLKKHTQAKTTPNIQSAALLI
jgi:hypothetical protein